MFPHRTAQRAAPKTQRPDPRPRASRTRPRSRDRIARGELECLFADLLTPTNHVGRKPTETNSKT